MNVTPMPGWSRSRVQIRLTRSECASLATVLLGSSYLTDEMLSLLSILSEQSEESMDWRTVQISSNDDTQEEMI